MTPEQPPTPPVSCTRSCRDHACSGNALQTAVTCAAGAGLFYGSLYALLWWWL